MEIEDVKDLIAALDASSVDELSLEQGDMKISLKKHEPAIVAVPPAQVAAEPAAVAQQAVPTPSPAPEVEKTETSAREQEEAEDKNSFTVTSPMVGTFYAAPSPGADPYVQEGDTVNEETVVCIVEAMKLMNPIVADVKGRITKIVVENGELVEYGQPLMIVERT